MYNVNVYFADWVDAFNSASGATSVGGVCQLTEHFMVYRHRIPQWILLYYKWTPSAKEGGQRHRKAR